MCLFPIERLLSCQLLSLTPHISDLLELSRIVHVQRRKLASRDESREVICDRRPF